MSNFDKILLFLIAKICPQSTLREFFLAMPVLVGKTLSRSTICRTFFSWGWTFHRVEHRQKQKYTKAIRYFNHVLAMPDLVRRTGLEKIKFLDEVHFVSERVWIELRVSVRKVKSSPWRHRQISKKQIAWRFFRIRQTSFPLMQTLEKTPTPNLTLGYLLLTVLPTNSSSFVTMSLFSTTRLSMLEQTRLCSLLIRWTNSVRDGFFFLLIVPNSIL